MNTPLIIANWKMNHTISETTQFAEKLLASKIPPPDKVEIVICPPFTSLPSLFEKLKKTDIKLGAQNCHWESSGAFTGEISAKFLKECGCSYVIVGHSERREIFGETDEMINRKLKAVLDYAMIPIFCVGEKKEERKAGQTLEVISRQIEKGLEGISSENLKKLVVAYEPVWAIGTGENASPAQAQEVHHFIRKKVGKIRVLYGGSVKGDNVASLMKEKDIDGALVGGASLAVDSFVKIVNDALTSSRQY